MQNRPRSLRIALRLAIRVDPAAFRQKPYRAPAANAIPLERRPALAFLKPAWDPDWQPTSQHTCPK